jgi:hypothetical protein
VKFPTSGYNPPIRGRLTTGVDSRPHCAWGAVLFAARGLSATARSALPCGRVQRRARRDIRAERDTSLRESSFQRPELDDPAHHETAQITRNSHGSRHFGCGSPAVADVIHSTGIDCGQCVFQAGRNVCRLRLIGRITDISDYYYPKVWSFLWNSLKVVHTAAVRMWSELAPGVGCIAYSRRMLTRHEERFLPAGREDVASLTHLRFAILDAVVAPAARSRLNDRGIPGIGDRRR